MGKKILAVLIGVVLGGIVVAIVQSISPSLFPLPEGMDPMDPESIRAYMNQIPTGALILVLAAYALGALAGGFSASYFLRSTQPTYALAVAGILELFGIINVVMIPHPVWMVVAVILVFVPFALLGHQIATRLQKAK